jgi:hypothetical protein
VQHERTSRIFSSKTHEACRSPAVIGGHIRVDARHHVGEAAKNPRLVPNIRHVKPTPNPAAE